MKKYNNFKKKRILYQIFILFGLFSALFLTLMSNLNFSLINPLDANEELLDFPRNSAIQDITVITPINNTYSAPMSGYYPGINGFENDPVGEFPTGLTRSGSDDTVEVIQELAGHKKVLMVAEDASAEGWDGAFYIPDSPVQYGTFEFYWRFDAIEEETYISARTSAGTGSHIAISFGIYVDLGNFASRDSMVNTDLPNVDSPQANHWYHVRVDFRCYSAPAYLGLSEDVYNVSIDGINSGEIPLAYTNSLDVGSIYFGTGDDSSNVNVYYDALGYSWDPDYEIGDNMNEGLLLSYENSTNLEWTGYSLDGETNITISGNTTIPMLDEGRYSIQVFGNNSQGRIFESNIRHFIVDFTAPISSISFTAYSEANIVVKSTEFTITADDGIGSGVFEIKYRINNSGWIDYNGPFDLSDFDPGYYNISYYSMDNANHMETLKAVLVVLIELPPGTQIPGFDILFIVGIVFIVSIYILKKRNKLIK